MPTLGIEAKLTLSTKQARTNVYDLYRGIETDGIRQAQHALLPSNSITLDLTGSSVLIVTTIEDYLTVDITDVSANTFTFTNMGFLILNAINLAEIVITNMHSEILDVYVFY